MLDEKMVEKTKVINQSKHVNQSQRKKQNNVASVFFSSHNATGKRLDREAEWQWGEIQQCLLRVLLEQLFKDHPPTPPLIPAILSQVKNREIAL